MVQLRIFKNSNVFKQFFHSRCIGKRIYRQTRLDFVGHDQQAAAGNQTFWRNESRIALDIEKFDKFHLVWVGDIENNHAVGPFETDVRVDATVYFGKRYILRLGAFIVRTPVVIHPGFNCGPFSQIAAIVDDIAFAVHDGKRPSAETDHLFGRLIFSCFIGEVNFGVDGFETSDLP